MPSAFNRLGNTKRHLQRLPFKLRLLGAAALLVCLLFSTLWLLSPRPKEPPPIVIFPPHYTVPAQKGPLLERWIPFSWSMYWRLREKVVGKKKVITLRISVYDLDSAGLEPATASKPVAELASLLAKPDLTAHGVRVWLLPGAAVKKIQSTLRRLPGTESNVMGITTADGMQAVLSTGNNNAMTIMSVLPVLRRD